MATAESTATDIIVEAMENAEAMEECIVIYRLKKDSANHSGCGWISNIDDRNTRVGLLHEAQFLMFVKSYGIAESEEES